MVCKLRFLSGEITQSDFDTLRHATALKECLARHRLERIPVYCLCRGGERPPLPLSVVLRDAFHLRCYKYTSHQHHEACLFFEDQPSLERSRQIPGVTRDDDDLLKISIDEDIFPLRTEERVAVAPVADLEADTASSGGGSSRGAIRLLGLFRLLLEEAQITTWRPSFAGKRSPSWLLFRLRQAADRIEVPVARAFLSELILWGQQPLSIGDVHAHMRSNFSFKTGFDAEILMCAQLTRASLSTTGKSFLLNFAGLKPPVLATPEQWEDIRKRRGPSLQFTHRQPTYPTFALFSVRTNFYPAKPHSSFFLNLTSIAPVIFSKEFVPAESSYEATFADYLCDCGRAFEKPLRYSMKDAFFPDFILTDTEPLTFVEVWGRTDPLYLKRKTDKRDRYVHSQQPFIEWPASERAPLPALPTPATKKGHYEHRPAGNLAFSDRKKEFPICGPS